MAQISVTVNGVTFNVLNQKYELDSTWDDIVRGLWEPQTFKIISTNPLTSLTSYKNFSLATLS